MDQKPPILEWKGYAVLIVSFLISLIFMVANTEMKTWSFIGAAIFAVMIWIGFITLRIIRLSAK